VPKRPESAAVIWLPHRTAEGDGIGRLVRAKRGRQIYDEVAVSASKLQLGGLANRLPAQAAMRFQDLRKGTRWWLRALGSSRSFETRERFHKPRLALRDVDEPLPFAVERLLVNHADRLAPTIRHTPIMMRTSIARRLYSPMLSSPTRQDRVLGCRPTDETDPLATRKLTPLDEWRGHDGGS
jgi:hypothetical protein